jgi:hypothetical protein
MKNYVNLWGLAQFFLQLKMFQTKVVKKIKTHFMFNNFFRKSRLLWDIVEKYGTGTQATGDSIWRRRKVMICIPDN